MYEILCSTPKMNMTPMRTAVLDLHNNPVFKAHVRLYVVFTFIDMLVFYYLLLQIVHDSRKLFTMTIVSRFAFSYTH